jgi:hypothetical protein
MSTIGAQAALGASAPGPWELIGRDMIRTERTEHGGGDIVAQFWTSPSAEHARLMVAAPLLLAALQLVEWSGVEDREEGGYETVCACCSAPKAIGLHRDDCQLAAAIAKAGAA